MTNYYVLGRYIEERTCELRSLKWQLLQGRGRTLPAVAVLFAWLGRPAGRASHRRAPSAGYQADERRFLTSWGAR